MFKKAITASAIAALSLASLAIAAPAQAGEGGTSIGHGVKCYYYLGIQYCRKGV